MAQTSPATTIMYLALLYLHTHSDVTHTHTHTHTNTYHLGFLLHCFTKVFVHCSHQAVGKHFHIWPAPHSSLRWVSKVLPFASYFSVSTTPSLPSINKCIVQHGIYISRRIGLSSKHCTTFQSGTDCKQPRVIFHFSHFTGLQNYPP